MEISGRAFIIIFIAFTLVCSCNKSSSVNGAGDTESDTSSDAGDPR
jgi:hypothetical protein